MTNRLRNTYDYSYYYYYLKLKKKKCGCQFRVSTAAIHYIIRATRFSPLKKHNNAFAL